MHGSCLKETLVSKVFKVHLHWEPTNPRYWTSTSLLSPIGRLFQGQCAANRDGQNAYLTKSSSRYAWINENCPKLTKLAIETLKVAEDVRDIFNRNGLDAFLGKEDHAKKLDEIP